MVTPSTRPSLDEFMMGIAQLAAQRTTCVRRGVGCVLANAKGHVLAVGYNGVAAGLPHCNELKRIPVYHNDPRVKKYTVKGQLMFQFEKQKREVALSGLDADKGNLQCVGFEHLHLNACHGHDLPPGQDSCEAVHAEQNAILQCRDPWQIETAYVSLSPCKACLKLLLNTSCKRIVFLQEHVDPLPKQLWISSGRVWEQFKKIERS